MSDVQIPTRSVIQLPPTRIPRGKVPHIELNILFDEPGRPKVSMMVPMNPLRRQLAEQFFADLLINVCAEGELGSVPEGEAERTR